MLSIFVLQHDRVFINLIFFLPISTPILQEKQYRHAFYKIYSKLKPSGNPEDVALRTSNWNVFRTTLGQFFQNSTKINTFLFSLFC